VPIEVIAVTARAASEDIRASLHLGVIDYLVKPFEPDRLRRSLHQVRRRLSILGSGMSHQAAVDELQLTAAPARRWIPKDLRGDRLRQIRSVLGGAPEPLTAEQVGSLVSVARVTARRYLEYLVTTEEAEWSPLGEGQGRRSKAYRLVHVGTVQDTLGVRDQNGRWA
jgi:response regulator of citrate/malate metabolism